VLSDHRRTLKYLIDFLHLFFSQQTEFHRPNVFLHLCNGLKARDGNGPITARPYPGERNLRKRSWVTSFNKKILYRFNALEIL